MIVLGVDPGYAIVGFGVIEFTQNRYRPLVYGDISTDASMPFDSRLLKIYDGLSQVIAKCRPDAMAVEKLYFQSNQKTAIMVAEARGVILLAGKKAGVPVFEYTPLQVKTAVTGYGKAKKQQMIDMTGRLLKIDGPIKPDDTADALAIAICHTQAAGSRLRLAMLKS